MTALTEAIGRAIGEFREKKHLTREALAAGAYVSTDEIAAAEDGSLLLSTGKLERIADALGLLPFPLFKGCAVVRPALSLFFRHGSVPDFFDDDVDRLQ